MGSHVFSVPNCRISKLVFTWKGIFVGSTVAALVQVNLLAFIVPKSFICVVKV